MAASGDCNGAAQTKRDDRTIAHIAELMEEKRKLNSEDFPNAHRLITDELKTTEETGKSSFDTAYVDLYNEKPIKVTVKVKLPLKEFPTFNFIGKLLGKKGSVMKQLSEDTKCKYAILGRGSVRDKNKEEEFRNSNDPKYAHLSEELHLEIACIASPAEAHSRIAYALKEVKPLIQPDSEEDYGYMDEPMMGYDAPMMGGGPMRRPMMNPYPMSNANAMSFLEKARHSMDAVPPPGRRFQRNYDDMGPPAPRLFQDDPQGQWVSGGGSFKPAMRGRRQFPPRAGPYGRP